MWYEVVLIPVGRFLFNFFLYLLMTYVGGKMNQHWHYGDPKRVGILSMVNILIGQISGWQVFVNKSYASAAGSVIGCGLGNYLSARAFQKHDPLNELIKEKKDEQKA